MTPEDLTVITMLEKEYPWIRSWVPRDGTLTFDRNGFLLGPPEGDKTPRWYAGDSVAFVHAATLQPYAAGKVVKAQLVSEREILLQLASPFTAAAQKGDCLENITCTPNLTVRNCLFEGTNLSEGRGTTRPFEYVGAPWLDPFIFAGRMARAGLDGYAFRPASFTPTFSKHAGSVCGGLQIYVIDREIAQPVALGIELIRVAHELSGDAFEWRLNEQGAPFIDLLYGSDRLRLGEPLSSDPLVFAERRAPFLFYSE